jgi:hypothetical protein
MRLLQAIAILVCLAVGTAGSPAAQSWQTFSDPAQRYSIDLPVGTFTLTNTEQRMLLEDRAHDAQIEIYAGRNSKALSVSEFFAAASQAQGVADVTYHAGGRTWFVLSGHYTRDSSGSQRLIYYAKFVFSADLSRFAAFETSYPVSAKIWMDPVVARLERSLRVW